MPGEPNLIGIARLSTLTDGRRTFSYDAKSRMTAADGHAYGYNALGQRAFKPRFQSAAPGDADGDGVIDQNDLLALKDMIKGKIPASPGADCNGDGAIDNQDTNCIALQIGATKNQGIGKNAEPEATVTATAEGDFTQAGWILFAYDEAGNPIRRYVWLEDLPVAVISAERIHYLHADHLNTPKAVTDPSGAIVWQADYQPFGEVTESGEFGLNLRFPGQYHDRETGLYQNWHREYVPELGRYSQSDPIGLQGGSNSYIYAYQNSLRYSDPMGLNPIGCYILKLKGGDNKSLSRCFIEEEIKKPIERKVTELAEIAKCGIRCSTECGVDFVVGTTVSSTLEEGARQVAKRVARGVAQKWLLRGIPIVGGISTVASGGKTVHCITTCWVD